MILRKNSKNNFGLILIAYVVVILVLHVIPTGGTGVALNRMEIGELRADYLVHSALFLPWMPLVLIYLRSGSPVPASKPHIACWLMLGLVIAFVAEGAQYWIPYRSFNPMDVIFNKIGVLAGSLALFLPERFFAQSGTDGEATV